MRTFRVLAGITFGVAAVAAAVPAATAVAGTSAGRAAAPATPAVRYVALGDSYSSGVGAGDYISSSGSCERSELGYPELWAEANSPASFRFAACSGASTSDVISSQLSSLGPGTTLVSITAGGNDAGFSRVMETCVLGWDAACLSAVSKAETFIAGTLPGRLDTMLRDIRARAPSARIVVLDYPDLYDLSRSGGCVGLDTTKRTALDQGANDLDNAIKAAASRNGDVFTDVRREFSGHEICDTSSWLHSVTLPLGDSYHPTASGQRLGYLPAFAQTAG